MANRLKSTYHTCMYPTKSNARVQGTSICVKRRIMFRSPCLKRLDNSSTAYMPCVIDHLKFVCFGRSQSAQNKITDGPTHRLSLPCLFSACPVVACQQGWRPTERPGSGSANAARNEPRPASSNGRSDGNVSAATRAGNKRYAVPLCLVDATVFRDKFVS